MSQAARVEKFEKITPGRPPGQPLPCKSPYGAPRAKNLGWDVLILGFYMVMHKKATMTLGTKPSIFGHFLKNIQYING